MRARGNERGDNLDEDERGGMGKGERGGEGGMGKKKEKKGKEGEKWWRDGWIGDGRWGEILIARID